jgi:hypothetical protein
MTGGWGHKGQRGALAGAVTCQACFTSHAIRHTSHVTRHTSHVTRHTPYVTHHTSGREKANVQNVDHEDFRREEKVLGGGGEVAGSKGGRVGAAGAGGVGAGAGRRLQRRIRGGQ